MSLSERLKAAEAARQIAEHPLDAPEQDAVVLDLRPHMAPLLDLTDVGAEPLTPPTPLPLPVDEDRRSDHPCPRCGGVTQIDLFDQVHQTVSLSCTECFHMFRVEQ